ARPVRAPAIGAAAHRGQDLTRVRVRHHELAARRARLLERTAQRLVRDLLEVLVDREIDVAAGHRLRNAQHLARDRPPARAAPRRRAARATGEDGIELQLHAAQRATLEVHAAEQLRTHTAMRIEALLHLLEVDAIETVERFAHLGLEAAAQRDPAPLR